MAGVGQPGLHGGARPMEKQTRKEIICTINKRGDVDIGRLTP